MSKVYTTFVLGAGLSANYGFPTGPGLIQLILKELPESDSTNFSGVRVSGKFQNVMNRYLERSPEVNVNSYGREIVSLVGLEIKSKLREGNVSSIDSYINEFSNANVEDRKIKLHQVIDITLSAYNEIAAYILKGLIFLLFRSVRLIA